MGAISITSEFEPLNSDVWGSQVSKIILRLADTNGDIAMLPRFLRQTFHLCELAPVGLRLSKTSRLDEPAFELLLDQGHLLPAAMMFLRDKADCSFSHKNGLAEVALSYPPLGIEAKARASTSAGAVLLAFLYCLDTAYSISLAGPADHAQDATGHKSPRELRP